MESIIVLLIFLISLFFMFSILGIPRIYQTQTTTQSTEGFIGEISLQSMSTSALDSAPSTSEAKEFYKLLLLFSDASIRKGGNQAVQALRILADFRDRLFDIHDFREELTVDDFLADYPAWIPPVETTISESATYTCADASTAEAKLLAYLQRYFPQEDSVDEQTGSTVRNIIQDFGKRFVFSDGESVELAEDFMSVPLLRGWVNPCNKTK